MAPRPSDAQPSPDGDEALARFEDVLLGLPLDRALPDLDDLLARAKMDPEQLRRDERARASLHEAIAARPLASLEVIQDVRTEVELLTLEVEVLTQRLADPSTRADVARRATERLELVRARLDEIRALL